VIEKKKKAYTTLILFGIAYRSSPGDAPDEMGIVPVS
jgi:hypothetical protein